MISLFYKFHHGTLTPDELREFRILINGMTDEEIDAALNDCADRDFFPDAKTIADIKRKIDTETGRRINPGKIYRWVSIAAAVLLPVLLASGIYFYREANRFSEYRDVIARDITLSTGAGESVNTTLPDGSVIRLGPQSTISYSLSTFNDSGRLLELDGGGYFDVAKKADSPFRINAAGIGVRVTGTKFRLTAHSSSDISELYLAEGAVELHSDMSDRTVSLSPHQLATVDKRTGSITVTAIEDRHEAKAILQGALVFRNEPLSQVLFRLGNAYGRKFDLRVPDYTSDRFTGFLPTDNLEEALDVLETSYHLRATVNGPTVILQ